MITDATGPDRARFDRVFDVCVIGAGPAGITLARRLAARGLDVALMEGGGRYVSGESQDLYVGEIVGLDYFDLDVVRLRSFGGCSTHWTGRCRTLDPVDFTPLPQRPLAWPIGPEAIEPHAAEASRILDMEADREGPDLPLLQAEERFRNVQFRHSPADYPAHEPTRFGEKYYDEIAATPGITAGLNANLVDLRLDDDLATVTGAVFRSYEPGDPGFTIRARAYALCAGGFETPRLLLNFTSQKPMGIGNDHDLVGRHFCEHPTIQVADVLFDRPQMIQEQNLAPTRAFMDREEVLNFVLRVTWLDRGARSPYEALKYAGKCATPFAERLAERITGYAPKCRWRGWGEYGTQADPERHPTGFVWLITEQALNRDSRVTLAETRDAMGLRRLRFDWRLTDLDYHTMKTAMLALGAHFAETGTGRIRIDDWLMEEDPQLPRIAKSGKYGRYMSGAYHQMCTLRMDADPRAGVVDGNCRVHGTENLYIGGSGAFATPGFANPTYTIVKMALRLGEHLADTLAQGARPVAVVPGSAG